MEATVSAACELSEGAEPEQRKEGRRGQEAQEGKQMRPRLRSAAIMFGQFHDKK